VTLPPPFRVDNREHLHGIATARPGKLSTMETKDTFMRFVVIGSIVLVGALALIVRLHT
jgi:hypothetical protein